MDELVRHRQPKGSATDKLISKQLTQSPDELIAKDFRQIQSSRRGFQPYGRSEWIRAIKRIHRRGESVFAGDLQKKHAYLYNQGVWIFGDWDRALYAAGFDPEKVRMRRFWEPERIVSELKRMRKQHLPLYAYSVMENQPDLFKGALRQYGSWRKALLAAGIEAVPKQTRPALLRELCEAEESGSEISQALCSAIEYYFGSLRKARIALKTDPAFLRSWSKSKIIAVLIQRHRSKQTLAYAAVRHELPALVSAAERYFGSWGKALHAAGINPNSYFVRHAWRKEKRRMRVSKTVGNA